MKQGKPTNMTRLQRVWLRLRDGSPLLGRLAHESRRTAKLQAEALKGMRETRKRVGALEQDLRALRDELRTQQTRRIESLTTWNRHAREELRTFESALDDATRHLATVQRHVEQLKAARADDTAATQRLDRLAPLLDRRRVAAHVHEAVGRATVVAGPSPHAIVAGVLPAAVYRAVTNAIPPEVFFHRVGDDEPELLLPPLVAPLDSAAAWTFVSEIVAEALVPALAMRLDSAIGRNNEARSPLRQPGVSALASASKLIRGRPSRAAGPGDVLTTLLSLARGGGDSDGNVAVMFVPTADATPETWLPPVAARSRYTLVSSIEADTEPSP